MSPLHPSHFLLVKLCVLYFPLANMAARFSFLDSIKFHSVSVRAHITCNKNFLIQLRDDWAREVNLEKYKEHVKQSDDWKIRQLES